jgi:NitT/TauT family transport system permease protein
MPPTEVDDRVLAELDLELAGLDALDRPTTTRPSFRVRAWNATWPKLAAVAIAIGLWQLVVWSGWRPEYVLPAPATVFAELWSMIEDGTAPEGVLLTLQRAAVGYELAVIIGGAVGVAMARWSVLRSALGAFITGLQTMPSIAWLPLAILLFKLSESAITFVVVLGAAPSIANGVLSGADNVPPLLVRSGRVLGAKGLGLYRTVVLPASLPGVLGGLKQGWAFAWRSLMAGELLVIVPGVASVGAGLQFSRDLSDAAGLMAWMIVILVIGIVIDSLVFGSVERWVRRRWGLVDAASF